MVTITCQPYDVTTKDAVLDDEIGIPNVNIHLWCLDRENKPVLVRVRDFPAYCYIELPKIVNGTIYDWDESSAGKVFDYIKKVMGDNAPFEWLFGRFQKLYYYQGDIKYPMLFVKFRTLEALQHCNNLLSKPRNIYPFGTIQMNVYESRIDIIRKFYTTINANFCQWLRVTGTEYSIYDDERISTNGTAEKPIREISVSYKNIEPVPSAESETWFVQPRILAFDIETYSDNHKAMPNSLNPKHVCNIISCIYYELGNKDSRKKYVIVLGDSKPQEGCEVIKVQTELELIQEFCKLIEKLDPEIISGYNIFAYDYPYLNNRLSTKMEDWMKISRIVNKPVEMSSMVWKSGAYGTQTINILQMEGRMSIDMLPIIKRDYRLDKYDLDTVSNTFIGRGKLDVKPVDMFRAYERQEFVIRYAKQYIQNLLGENVSNWVIKEKLDEISNLHPEEKTECDKIKYRYDLALDEVTRIVSYCIQDSDLVVDLFDKLNVWIGLNALSSVVGVTIIQLFTRGQQVRCLSQVYDKATRKGIVLDKRIKDKVFYEGGFVFEPKPGLYTGVICLDFASLYPSIMRAYNICFTTLVPQEHNDVIPDTMAETIEVNQEEPVGLSQVELEKLLKKQTNAIEEGGVAHAEIEGEDEIEGEESSSPKTIMKVYKYKWVNKQVRYGILPEIQDHLVGSRNVIKKEIAALEDELEDCTEPKRLAEIKMLLVLKDKYSNALKVSANSLYGFLGAQEGGVLSLIEAAMCITATGRNLINKVNRFVETKYGASVVYGDSVTGDTPIFIMNEQGTQDVIRIDELIKNNDRRWSPHRDSKEIIDMENLNISIMTDKEWTKIKKFIRHKLHPSKKLFRIITNSGMVDVTEDHSLILANGKEISPKDVKIGTELLHNHTQFMCLNHDLRLKIKDPENYLKVNNHINYLGKLFNKFWNNEAIYIENDADAIISISELEHPGDIYVYDLETENHHFAVGPGALVVHNTDSSMIDMHVPIKEVFNRGLELAQEITYGTKEKVLEDGTIVPASPPLFPPPLKIEFEKAMKMCCFKKKKYAAFYIDKNGEYMREKNKDGSLGEYKILKRGIIVARRDTAKIVHKTYNKLLLMVLKEEPIVDSFNLIIDTIDNLMNDRIPARGNLSIIRSYAGNYASETYFMKIFGDELIRMGKPVNPSDRLEYVIVKTEKEKNLAKGEKFPLGLKMRLIEMYEESQKLKTEGESESLSEQVLAIKNDPTLVFNHNEDPLRVPEESTAMYPPEKIDYEYYIGHVLMAPLDQLFSIGYMRQLASIKDNLGYKPLSKVSKQKSIAEPIQMISKMIEDYHKQGYTDEQIKSFIPSLKEIFKTAIESVKS